MTRPEAVLIDELEFRSYVHNRKQFPEVEPERWALIFSNVPEMEEQYLDMLSTGNILDVAPELSATTGGIRGKEDGARAECIPSSPGEVSSTPLYLLASEIVDVVTKGYEQ